MPPTYLLIRHITRFIYSSPIQENTMEVRLQPLEDDRQRCHEFALTIRPKTDTFHHLDAWGNTVHHFDIPSPHVRLEITSEATVGIEPPPLLPDRLALDAWRAVDAMAEHVFWHFTHDSHFARHTPALNALAQHLQLSRRADPLTTLLQLNAALYDRFEYDQTQTKVDSPIDVALAAGGGVCQDFAHIMTALVRGMGVPCRYVSGYLVRDNSAESGERSVEDESHAWVEAWLPELGWVGFDPTNNLIASDRHVRVAIGRDYADVPPTRGVFIGSAETTLSVGVHVGKTSAPAPPSQELLPELPWQQPPPRPESMWQAQQQQQ